MSGEKIPKSLFVIMPFMMTPSRGEAELTLFFQDFIKGPVEAEQTLAHQYQVSRSGNKFNINEEIIRDLYASDIVVCDLSGHSANPNVMYELGVRLSVSRRPVILIREEHEDNHEIFDIAGFHTFSYRSTSPQLATRYIIQKLHVFESGSEIFESPVLKATKREMPLAQELSAHRAARSLVALSTCSSGVMSMIETELKTQLTEHGLTPEGRLWRWMQDNSESVSKVFGERAPISFQLGSHPALDAYLSSMYLIELIDKELEKWFTDFVIGYHAHFYSADILVRSNEPKFLIALLAETKILVDGSNALASYVLGGAADQNLRERVLATLIRSHLITRT